MPEETSLRILLACGRPLVLKVQRWAVALDEEARPHIEVAADKLKEVAEPGDIEAHGKTLIFDLYPPAPDGDFLRNALKSVTPLQRLDGVSAPLPMDAVRPGEEVEAVRQGLARLNRDIHIIVHGAATLPDVRELLNADPGFDVLQFIGHGGESGALYFEDGSGGARRVKPDELARLVHERAKLLVTMGVFPKGLWDRSSQKTMNQPCPPPCALTADIP